MAETDSSRDARLAYTTVLASMVGLWLCYFLLTTARGLALGIDVEHDIVWRRALVCVAGVGVTGVLWVVIRAFEHRALWLKIAVALLASMPAAILIAQINQWIFAPVQERVETRIGEKRGVVLRRDEAGNLLIDVPGAGTDDEAMEEEGPPQSVVLSPSPTALDRWRQTIEIAIGRYFLLLAWCSLYLALLAGAQASAAERREERFRSAAKAAELRSLRYQVNPHFLFNTLNSLSSLVMTGKADRAEEMIQSISNFYRRSLAEDPTSDVALKDEFALQRHYLDIETARFPERLRVDFQLPKELATALVPGMILQPLVENSVKYAVAPNKRPVTITIAAREEYQRLVVTVSDDGPGVEDGSGHGFGIGLANVRDRLEARFGDEANVVSGPVAQGYATVLRLPLEHHG